jgi:hypothetical protein
LRSQFIQIAELDANLTWAVGELFPGDSWHNLITPGRFEKAVALRAERQRRGSEWPFSAFPGLRRVRASHSESHLLRAVRISSGDDLLTAPVIAPCP